MVHTILVEPTKWWLLTICKRLMICRCRQNIRSDLVEGNKIGWDHLAGGGKMVSPELVKSYTDNFLTKIFQHFC